LITHEAPKHNSLSSEIASQVMESCFYSLVSPIERVCGLDTPFPLSLEPLYLPSKFKVKDALKRLLEN
jgi:2-oxoisovalerate dehydrogenase E1 component beta subunit